MKRSVSVLAVSLLLSATAALAGPPLATDDAGTVEVGKVEVELNGSIAFDRESAGGVITKRSVADGEMKITTGLHKDLGISLAVPYTFSDRSKEDGQLTGTADGFGDMTLELKYAFVELAGIRLAIKPTVILPTGRYSAGLSEGRWQFGGVLIATREFEDGKYALHANLGYEHHSYRTGDVRSVTRSDLLSGSIAGEAEVMKGLFAVADFGLATATDKGVNDPAAYALAGLRYELNDHIGINAAVKVGLTRPEDDVAILYGVTLKF